MKRHLRYVLLVSLVLTLAFAAWPAHIPNAQAISYYSGSMTITCTGQTNDLKFYVDRNNTAPNSESYRLIATDGYGTILYQFDGTSPLSGGTPVGLVSAIWAVAPQGNPIIYKIISKAGNGLAEQISFVQSGNCPGLPTIPGPDDVAMPAGSVVGAFVATTPLYRAPQADATTTYVMDAGKTLWVLGVDASGMYYKVILAGGYYWVPVSTMGPNYDAVWNGTPLPVTVVN